MSNSIKIVQLKDKKSATPITPYVSASAVYYQYVEEGEVKQTNMEVVYGGLDSDRIADTQEAAVSAITSQAAASVEKIETEGDSYQNSIDELNEIIGRIGAKAFPLEVETTYSGNTSTPGSSNAKKTYSYRLTENDELAVGATVNVFESINNGSYQNIHSGSEATWSSNVNMVPGTDTYHFIASKGDKTVEKYDTKFLWFYGSFTETMSNENVLQYMNRKFTEPGSFDVTMTPSSGNQYLWFVIPSNVTVDSITSDGIEVTVTKQNVPNEVTLNQKTVAYNAYRTDKALASGFTWNITINLVYNL